MPTRREFAKAVGAFAAGSIAGPVPWAALSEQKHTIDPTNHYGDFEAFDEWWAKQCERYEWADLHLIGANELIALYRIIGDLYDQAEAHVVGQGREFPQGEGANAKA